MATNHEGLVEMFLEAISDSVEEIERQKVAALREIARRPPATEAGGTVYDEEYERWWE